MTAVLDGLLAILGQFVAFWAPAWHLQGRITKSPIFRNIIICPILVSGRAQEGSRGSPRGAQDLILYDFGTFFEQKSGKTDTTKHSNRYHKKVVWRGHLSLKSGIPQTQGTQFGHGGGEAAGNWIRRASMALGVVPHGQNFPTRELLVPPPSRPAPAFPPP